MGFPLEYDSDRIVEMKGGYLLGGICPGGSVAPLTKSGFLT